MNRGGSSWLGALAWGFRASGLYHGPWAGGLAGVAQSWSSSWESLEVTKSVWQETHPHSSRHLALVCPALPQCLPTALGGLVSWGGKLATERLGGGQPPPHLPPGLVSPADRPGGAARQGLQLGGLAEGPEGWAAGGFPALPIFSKSMLPGAQGPG